MQVGGMTLVLHLLTGLLNELCYKPILHAAQYIETNGQIIDAGYGKPNLTVNYPH